MRQRLGYLFFVLTLNSSSLVAYGQSGEFWQKWQRLLHYQNYFGGYKSTIDHSGFFFAKGGKFDPRAELQATLTAFRSGSPKVGPQKLDPWCAFPARAMLLRDSGLLKRDLSSSTCPHWHHWRDNLKLRSISMVFSSAYSGNPASMLGHTFLKFNLQTDGSSAGTTSAGTTSAMLDYGASFSALPEESMGFTYFFNGLTGGYKGIFSIEPFYIHAMSYAYGENRDLWEYELDLSAQQVDYLLAHFWELYASAYVDYYFLDDNCSKLLIEVLAILVPGEDIVATLSWLVTPHETIHVMKDFFAVKKVHFYPSLRRRFDYSVAVLSQEEKQKLTLLVKSSDLQRLDAFSNATLDAYLRWMTLQKTKLNKEDQVELRQKEQLVLKSRARRREVSPTQVVPRANNQPDRGHRGKRLSVGGQSAAGEKPYPYLGMRYGLHDLFDPAAGYEKYYHMSYGDLRLAKPGEQWRYDLRLFDILSLEPLGSIEKLISWRLVTGLRSFDFENGVRTCAQCFYLRGGAGGALEVFDAASLLYLMPQVEVKKDQHGSYQLVTHLELAGIHDWSALVRSRLRIHFERPSAAEGYSRRLSLQTSYATSRQSSLVAGIKAVGDTFGGELEWRRYF